MLVMSTVNPCHFGACLQYVSCCCIALKCVTCCWQIVFITCDACIFLTVTPFGVFFICNLTRISCTLCLCYQPKTWFREEHYQMLNFHGVLSDMSCLGLSLT